MYKERSTFRIIIIVGLVATLLLASCASSTTSSTAPTTGVVSSVTITDQIQTTGNLSASQLVQLTWATDGLIDQVNAVVGQKVKEGDILVSLKADSVTTDMITAQADLATAQRNLQNLTSTNLTAAQADQAVIAAKKAVETAQTNYDALNYAHASDTLILNTQAKIWDAQKTLTLANKAYKQVQNSPNGDPSKTAALLALTNAQLNLNTLVVTYNWYTAKATQEDFDTAKAALDVARAQWDDAKRQRDIVKTGVDPLALAAAQAKVAAQQAIVKGIYTIAPFDGEIIAVQAAPGNAVKAGDNAIAMVDRNTLKIDTQVDESAISGVKIGNVAQITMDSLPGVTLTGKVSLINPIGTTVSGLVKYTVTVAVDPTDKALMFGATTNVTILTGAPHSMLAVPVAAVLSDTKGEYVLGVLGDGSTQRVPVTSGDLSGSLVTITPTTAGSLKDGDTVQLGASTSTSSTTNRNGGGLGGPGGFGG